MPMKKSTDAARFRGRLRSVDPRKFAADIFRTLQRKSVRLESAGLFIAVAAIANKLPLVTLNRKHFEQIDGLKLLLPKP